MSEDNLQIAHVRGLVEKNPDLKTGDAFSVLFEQLVFAENQIAAARKFYNDAVTIAVTLKQQFPTNLLAPAAIGDTPPLLDSHNMI
jgi:hypothetical protein